MIENREWRGFVLKNKGHSSGEGRMQILLLGNRGNGSGGLWKMTVGWGLGADGIAVGKGDWEQGEVAVGKGGWEQGQQQWGNGVGSRGEWQWGKETGSTGNGNGGSRKWQWETEIGSRGDDNGVPVKGNE